MNMHDKSTQLGTYWWTLEGEKEAKESALELHFEKCDNFQVHNVRQTRHTLNNATAKGQ